MKLSHTHESLGMTQVYLPTIFVVVMYLDPLVSLLELSNQFRTSSTAWGFFFCSCLLMFELLSRSAQASGIPCKKFIHYEKRQQMLPSSCINKLVKTTWSSKWIYIKLLHKPLAWNMLTYALVIYSIHNRLWILEFWKQHMWQYLKCGNPKMRTCNTVT